MEKFKHSKANAKLIAATPELLEFLSDLLTDGNVPGYIKRKIEPLIAKATLNENSAK